MSGFHYVSRSTPDMIRVARMVTPEHEREHWALTECGRTWAWLSERWIGFEPDGTQVWHFDREMREMVAEQLLAYEVGEDDERWHMH